MTNKLKAFRLHQAIQSLNDAKRFIAQALGDSDVTQMYATELNNMIEDVERDMAEVLATPAGE